MATIHIEYLGDLRNDCEHLQSGTHLLTDAPTDNQGKGESFSPTDLVANALGTCIVTTMAIVAKRDGIELTSTSADVTKIMTTEPPRRIARIDVILTLAASRNGEPFTPDDSTRTKLERIAHSCPVALCLHPDVIQAVTINWAPTPQEA